MKYVLHANSGRFGETWVQVAEKAPGLPWLGSVQVVDNPGDAEQMVWRVSDSYSPATAGTRLYRLGVMVVEAAP